MDIEKKAENIFEEWVNNRKRSKLQS